MSQVLTFPSAPSPLAPQIRHPRTGFERLPRDLSRAELFRYFTFSEADLEQVRLCRGEANRLGFALLLGGVRLTGRFPSDLELLSPDLVAHVAHQLQINAPGVFRYPQRRPRYCCKDYFEARKIIGLAPSRCDLKEALDELRLAHRISSV